MSRIAVVGVDPAVVDALVPLLARAGATNVLRCLQSLSVSPSGVQGDLDVVDALVLDIWPPNVAEEACARWHRRCPHAFLVAIIHYPTAALVDRLHHAGASAVWPKGLVRGLPEYVLWMAQGATTP